MRRTRRRPLKNVLLAFTLILSFSELPGAMRRLPMLTLIPGLYTCSALMTSGVRPVLRNTSSPVTFFFLPKGPSEMCVLSMTATGAIACCTGVSMKSGSNVAETLISVSLQTRSPGKRLK